ncbi:unnamed protein product [Paramecium pentaurelia]|uniref:Uncharacterized protein n=1 Tax=Paramecium pentaurelia TaxID=43138 RepID=A0A8S1XGG1_9CILI|nr:unnamed protein product [Paramecium pentaurelia]
MQNSYEIAVNRASDAEERINYWREQSEFVDWIKKPEQILTKINDYFYQWFGDGKLNFCYNALDRHLIQRGNQVALYWESNMVHNSLQYTFNELHDHVSRLSGVYRQFGVSKGDRVIIYMPMIPEAVFAMLACSRIGAIHSVVFGGFSALELSGRIKDCKPTLIITASCGLEVNKIVDYKVMLDEAIQISNHTPICLIVQRPTKQCNMVIGRDFDYYTAMKFANPIECIEVESTHPLYILYTSGTTGQPKGIQRDTGGTVVALLWTMRHILGLKAGDVYFSMADIGWVTGHSFTVYGPLLQGCSIVLYEGKPVQTPDPGAIWRIIEKHKVVGFYTAPTALRAMRKEDPNGDWIRKSNISSLKSISMAGERCDIPTYNWIQSNTGVLINDHYWQTETGWIISCNFMDLHTFPSKAGSATKPSPGFVIKIMDNDNKEVETGQMGRICIRLPMPPSFMQTLYNNDEAFIQKYLSDTPGYYTAGDAGFFDQNGYLHIMTRIDDIINTAGHRLSTAAMEEVLLKHKDIVEAAVVAKLDDLRGEIPVGLIVIKQGHDVNPVNLEKELISMIRHDIGPLACFQSVIIVEKLPKTRSGKVLRGTLKAIVNGQQYKMPATIEDDSVLDKIKLNCLNYGKGMGQYCNLDFGNKDVYVEE